MKGRLCLLVGVFLCLLTSAGARPVPQEIEQHYQKMSVAAQIKFWEGLTPNRTDDYQCFDAGGQPQGSASERSVYRRLFERADWVNVTVKILQSQVGDGRTTCRVAQEWVVAERSDPGLLGPVHKESRQLEDIWVKQASGWKLWRSTVTSGRLP